MMIGVTNVQEYRISVDQLQVGVFIRLELAWFEHPFLFGRFKIKSLDQIATLKELGISTVLFVPGKSDQLPDSQPAQTQPQSETQQAKETVSTEALWNIKQERIARLRAQRERFYRCEKQFQKTLDRVRNIMKTTCQRHQRKLWNRQAHSLRNWCKRLSPTKTSWSIS